MLCLNLFFLPKCIYIVFSHILFTAVYEWDWATGYAYANSLFTYMKLQENKENKKSISIELWREGFSFIFCRQILKQNKNRDWNMEKNSDQQETGKFEVKLPIFRAQTIFNLLSVSRGFDVIWNDSYTLD